MLRPRIIPCLLVRGSGLVKTVRFADPKYIGDPINAVRIFNEKEVDEIIVLDIDATVEARDPDYCLIEKLSAECRMPLCFGGGIKSLRQAETIVSMGVEKIAISSAAVEDPHLVSTLAEVIGKQSVVAVLDVMKTGLLRKYEVVTHNAGRRSGQDPVKLARKLAAAGAGEILINSVDKDGTMSGYDIDLNSAIRHSVTVPVTALGGAGSIEHISELLEKCGILGVAAGSLFVFKGRYRAVLVSYLSREQKALLSHSAAA